MRCSLQLPASLTTGEMCIRAAGSVTVIRVRYFCAIAAAVCGLNAASANADTRSVVVQPMESSSVPAGPPAKPAGALGNRASLERRLNGVWATVPTDGANLPVGTRIRVCAKPEAGYLTLWLSDTEGTRQLYPNSARSSNAEAKDADGNGVLLRKVTGGERMCIGEGEGFRILVEKPLGLMQLKYIWTAQEVGQLNAALAMKGAQRGVVVVPSDARPVKTTDVVISTFTIEATEP